MNLMYCFGCIQFWCCRFVQEVLQHKHKNKTIRTNLPLNDFAERVGYNRRPGHKSIHPVIRKSVRSEPRGSVIHDDEEDDDDDERPQPPRPGLGLSERSMTPPFKWKWSGQNSGTSSVPSLPEDVP